VKQALISLWSALLPSFERQHLRQRLAWQPRTIEASWALAAVQVSLGPVWFLRGLAYAQAYAERSVTLLMNSPLADLERNAAGAISGAPLYFLSYAFTVEGLVLEYLILAGIFRIVVLIGSGQPVADPLVALGAWGIRAARCRAADSRRLRHLGPERPDRILEAPNGGLVVLSARQKLTWNGRVSIRFGEELFRLARTEERRQGEWTDIAYVLRPQEPGEIIREAVRLEGRVERKRPTTRTEPAGPTRAG
jgi:hypothetical protein